MKRNSKLTPKPTSPIDVTIQVTIQLTVDMEVVSIPLTATVTTPMATLIKPTTATTTRIVPSPASYARDPTAVPGSIRRRNRRQRRPDLGLKTSVSLILRSATPVTSISASIVPIYNTWPKLKANKIRVVKMS